MRYLTWIVTLPLLILFVVFAVANRTPIEVNLWPLDLRVSLPLFLTVLVTLFVGFVVGGLVSWWSGHRTRERARRARFEIDSLNRDLLDAKRQLARARADAEQAAATQPGGAQDVALLSGRN